VTTGAGCTRGGDIALTDDSSARVSLLGLLDSAESYRAASRKLEAGWCSVFQEIVLSHNAIMTPGVIQGNEYDLVVPVLLAKCSFAYFVAAVDVGLSRQTFPCFALLRTCIESAVYAYTIIGRPELSRVWILRHNTPEDKKNFDAAFKIRHLINSLPEAGVAPREAIQKLYDRAIDYGGHPNKGGALSVAVQNRVGGRYSVDIELFAQGLPFLHALKSAAEVGYGMVCLEDLAFNVQLAPKTLPDRIRALGVEGANRLRPPAKSSAGSQTPPAD